MILKVPPQSGRHTTIIVPSVRHSRYVAAVIAPIIAALGGDTIIMTYSDKILMK